MNKPVLMIHEIRENFFNLDLENYILTFDDGLYSQYYFYNRFSEINTKKIYFISTDVICEGKQSMNFPTCIEAHSKAFKGNKEDYMTLDQIKFLMEQPNVEIGAHSHTHTRLSLFDSLYEKTEYIKKDTETMLEWFEKNLKFKPTKFCFPYNDDFSGMYKSLLKKYNFNEFYGNERLDINQLIEKTSLKASA